MPHNWAAATVDDNPDELEELAFKPVSDIRMGKTTRGDKLDKDIREGRVRSEAGEHTSVTADGMIEVDIGEGQHRIRACEQARREMQEELSLLEKNIWVLDNSLQKGEVVQTSQGMSELREKRLRAEFLQERLASTCFWPACVYDRRKQLHT